MLQQLSRRLSEEEREVLTALRSAEAVHPCTALHGQAPHEPSLRMLLGSLRVLCNRRLPRLRQELPSSHTRRSMHNAISLLQKAS